jgi:hypothetical protein
LGRARLGFSSLHTHLSRAPVERLNGKETRVSSFARLKCTPLRSGLAEIHFPLFSFTGKEGKQAFLKTILEKGRSEVWVFLILMR